MKENLREWLRQQAFWQDFHRLRREGWRNGWNRWHWWPQILQTPPLQTMPHQPGAAVEVHMMCHARDWLLAIWALKTFYHYAEVRHPLVIHLQSVLPGSAESTLRHHLPDAKIISAVEATQKVIDHLVKLNLPRCISLRYATSFMPKLLDLEILAWSKNIISFDADILFFRKPTEMLMAGENSAPFQMFQQDIADNYNGLSYQQAKDDLGVKLFPLINTGITVRTRGGLDLQRIEHFGNHPVAGEPSGHTEQTLHALAASELGPVKFLPPTYALSLDGRMDCSELVCRHYAGPSKVWLALEGMPYLRATGFFADFKG